MTHVCWWCWSLMAIIFSCCWAKRCISVCRKPSDVFSLSIERVYSVRSISPGAAPVSQQTQTGWSLQQNISIYTVTMCYDHAPPPSSQGDLGAAPSGLHLSARSTLLWLVILEDVSGSGEGVSAPELGLRGAVTPFLLTTFRKAVLPILWRCRVKAASTWKMSGEECDVYTYI